MYRIPLSIALVAALIPTHTAVGGEKMFYWGTRSTHHGKGVGTSQFVVPSTQFFVQPQLTTQLFVPTVSSQMFVQPMATSQFFAPSASQFIFTPQTVDTQATTQAQVAKDVAAIRADTAAIRADTAAILRVLQEKKAGSDPKTGDGKPKVKQADLGELQLDTPITPRIQTVEDVSFHRAVLKAEQDKLAAYSAYIEAMEKKVKKP